MKLNYFFASTALLFLVLAVLVELGVTLRFDQAILYVIYSFSSPALNTFFIGITQFGGVLVVTSITLLLGISLLYRKMYSKALLVACGVGGGALLGFAFKSLFERNRPDLWVWIINETNFSFPSGHSVASAALALSLIVIFWNTKWRGVVIGIALAYTFLIGLSRMYLGVHFPTDVVGGWLLAGAWVSLLLLIVRYYKQRRPNKQQVKV